MSQTLRIGFLSPHNPFDRSAFSGTAFHMYRALAGTRDVEASVLGGHRPKGFVDRVLRRPIGRKAIDAASLDLSRLDVVIGMTALNVIADLAGKTTVPLVYVTDATPAFLREFYGRTITPEYEEKEARVVRTVALTVYSSHYMAERAAAEFGVPVERLAVVPFGANFDSIPSALPTKPKGGPTRLLWVGSNWKRKGGAIALDAYRALREQGVNARLSLVGDVPQGVDLPEGVDRVGYLDKSRRGDALRLERLFAEADLFVLPTRADCTPMVVAEANAQGTPVLITGTGGIATLVSEGQSGRMLPMEASPADWAEAIRQMTADAEAHAALCRTSFEHARVRLSWETWARDVTGLVRTLVG